MQKCDQSELVFAPYITLKNGLRLYARQFGKKKFRLRLSHGCNYHNHTRKKGVIRNEQNRNR